MASAPLRILSIGIYFLQSWNGAELTYSTDGGGVRGISSLMILGEVMRQAASRETGYIGLDGIRPCEYFDLIVGSGIGG